MTNGDSATDSKPVLRCEVCRGWLQERATSAIRFWELGRLIYNGVLIGVVVMMACVYWPKSPCYPLLPRLGLELFALAVLANVFYCAAYFPDLLMQVSDFRQFWQWGRWGLFVVGTLFAVVMTLAMTAGLIMTLGGESI